MAQQTINFGTAPAGTDGDTIRTALTKAQANFNDLYALTNANAASISGNEASTTASINALNPFSGDDNLLVNPNFDVWQRATNSPASVTSRYVADQWQELLSSDTIAASAQLFTPGQTTVPNNPTAFHRSVVTTAGTASSCSLLTQKIENVLTASGQTVTVSFWAKADAARPAAISFDQNFGTGGSPSAQGVGAGQPINLTAAWQKFTLTFNIPSITGMTLGANSDHSLSLNFWFSAGANFLARAGNIGMQSGTFDIAQVKVEYGSFATQFKPRKIAHELVLCQRYYEKSYDYNTYPGAISAPGYYQESLNGLTSVARTAISRVAFKVTKRGVPTFTVYSYNSGASGKAYDASGAGDTTPSSVNASTNSTTVNLTQSAAQVQYNWVYHWTAESVLA